VVAAVELLEGVVVLLPRRAHQLDIAGGDRRASRSLHHLHSPETSRFVAFPCPVFNRPYPRKGSLTPEGGLRQENALATSATTSKFDITAISEDKEQYMAIHLTPTELGREAGMHRREVITKCMEHGVPIFQGRIDKTLFLNTLKHANQSSTRLAKA
jgi:hypothetical protein